MVPVGIYALTLPSPSRPREHGLRPDLVRRHRPEADGDRLSHAAGRPQRLCHEGVVGKEISLETIFSGCMPFIALESVCLIILVMFPGLSTWLPNVLFGSKPPGRAIASQGGVAMLDCW